MSLIVQLELKALPGCEAEMVRLARALAAEAANEAGTLRYQWYTTATPGRDWVTGRAGITVNTPL